MCLFKIQMERVSLVLKEHCKTISSGLHRNKTQGTQLIHNWLSRLANNLKS